jgi:aconitate hydratase
MEFVGPGIENLTVEYRNGIDVMTTETTCLSSIWQTDESVAAYYATHGRAEAYDKLTPGDVTYYDKVVTVNLSTIIPMIALPFHPSNAYTIDEVNSNAKEILSTVEAEAKKIFGNNDINFNLTDKIINGKIQVDQGVVAGCSGGTFENIYLMGEMIAGKTPGNNDFVLNVYPASQPVFYDLNRVGSINKLMEAGVTIKTAFCGPCFGAGDVPTNNGLSIRHTTRNFPNREGSKPSDGQISSVALMDARSITATAINGGLLTSATEMHVPETIAAYTFNAKIYENRVYQGFNKPDKTAELKYAPNIKDWPTMTALTDHIMLEVATEIRDDVTTTDELIPSGETSSYRSNPLKLAEFTLSRKDPLYVETSKAVHAMEVKRLAGEATSKLAAIYGLISDYGTVDELVATTAIGSVIYANKPGDGSAREQAASCQKVLGGWANIAIDYATKRYRSNLVNWGLLPFTTKEAELAVKKGDYVFVPDVRKLIEDGADEFPAFIISDGIKTETTLYLPDMTKTERDTILAGCLINYYKTHK